MKKPENQNFFLFTLLCLLCFLMILGVLGYGLKAGEDFAVFYLAGKRVLVGDDLYQAADGWMPFKYHPFWAVFFSLWALIPKKASLLLFNILGLVCWFVAAKKWAQQLKVPLRQPLHYFILLLVSLSPLSAEIGYGQVNGFIFLSATWLALGVNSGRLGFLYTLISSLKLNFTLMAPLLLKGWKRSFAGAGVALAILTGVTFLFWWGNEAIYIYKSWVSLLLQQSSHQFTIYESQGFLRVLLLLSPQYGKGLWFCLLLVFTGFGLYMLKRQSRAVSGAYFLWLYFMFSPLAWWYQILFCYPLILLTFMGAKNLKYKAFLGFFFLLMAFANYNTLGKEGVILFKYYFGYFIPALIFGAGFLTKYCFKPIVLQTQRAPSP